MITSTSNNKIKNLIKCMKSAKERKKRDVFLVEGIRMFSEIPADLYIETYVTEIFYEKYQSMFENIAYELVSEHIMEVVSDTRTPQGVVSLVRQCHYSVDEIWRRNETPLMIALENIQDPGNLGTIIRTAEGAGVTGVLLSKDTVDIYNPKVVRSTMGSIFRVPFCYVENLAECMRDFSRKEHAVYSAHLQGTSFYDFDYQKPTIFCIGNEGNGLSKELLEATDSKIRIPMMGKVESLNAATAATVLMYEAMRQRST